MSRITEKDLQSVVDRINRITNSPATPYADGKAQIGNYHLNFAYGGVSLVRMHNEGGGVSSIISGFHPKRELYWRMQAFISGLDAKVQS